ncbi:MAG: hypothetical protein ACR2P5_08455 [Gammaproteobacteria bacterium]
MSNQTHVIPAQAGIQTSGASRSVGVGGWRVAAELRAAENNSHSRHSCVGRNLMLTSIRRNRFLSSQE